MEDKDNILVDQFLKSTKQDIHDDGFTDEIFQKIPEPILSWNHISQWLCYAIVFCVLVFGGGWEMISNTLAETTSYKHTMNTLMQDGYYIIIFSIITLNTLYYNFKDKLEI